MPVIDSPPSSNHLIERRAASIGFSPLLPRLVGANEVDHVDTGLEVPVGWDVLVVSRRRDVVCEGKPVVVVLEVHIQQALICAVERDAAFGHGHHGVVVAHVRGEHHDARVEEVRPADIRRSCEGVGQLKELVGSPVGDNIGVDVYDLAKLKQLPEIDLGEGRVEIPTVHEVQVRRVRILDPVDGEDVIVDSLFPSIENLSTVQPLDKQDPGARAYLELCYDLGRNAVEGDQNGQLLGRARIA